jgi:hypothetical protein
MVNVAIKPLIIASASIIYMILPTVIGLFESSCRKNAGGDSLGEHSKADTSHCGSSFIAIKLALMASANTVKLT